MDYNKQTMKGEENANYVHFINIERNTQDHEVLDFCVGLCYHGFNKMKQGGLR